MFYHYLTVACSAGEVSGDEESKAEDDKVIVRMDSTGSRTGSNKSGKKRSRSRAKSKDAESAAASETRKTKGKLVEAEERATGEVGFSDYTYYFKSGGLCLLFIVVLCFCTSRGFEVMAPFWLSIWTNAYVQAADPNDVDLGYYLGIYALIGLIGITFVTTRAVLVAYFRVRAAGVLHEGVLYRVLRAPTRFFDITPIGRILNRFTKDIDRIDLELAAR